jgi:hypothetical protein
MSVRKAVKIGVKGANSANVDAVFDPLILCFGASDVVQSIRFGPASLFRQTLSSVGPVLSASLASELQVQSCSAARRGVRSSSFGLGASCPSVVCV